MPGTQCLQNISTHTHGNALEANENGKRILGIGYANFHAKNCMFIHLSNCVVPAAAGGSGGSVGPGVRHVRT